MCFFFSMKASKINLFFFMGNFCLPAFGSILHPRQASNPFQPIRVVVFAVRTILTMCRFSKVLKSVVNFISVNVINLFNGHDSSHIKPCKPVSHVWFPIHFKIDVPSVLLHISCLIANSYFWAWGCPFKDPRKGIIRKDGEKVRVFHAGNLPELRVDFNSEGELHD